MNKKITNFDKSWLILKLVCSYELFSMCNFVILYYWHTVYMNAINTIHVFGTNHNSLNTVSVGLSIRETVEKNLATEKSLGFNIALNCYICFYILKEYVPVVGRPPAIKNKKEFKWDNIYRDSLVYITVLAYTLYCGSLYLPSSVFFYVCVQCCQVCPSRKWK